MFAEGINAKVKVSYKIKARKYALFRGDSKVTGRLGVVKKAYPQLTVRQFPDAVQGCW
jgi:hypothetical protein